MEPFLRFGLALSLLAFVPGSRALAAAAALETPASPEMERVWKLLGGDWNTEERMEKSELFPDGGARRGVTHYRLGQGGQTLIGEGQSDGSAGPLSYLMVIWWNANANHYGFFVCFNGGRSACQERGSARFSGEEFVNEYSEMFRGKSTRMVDTWTAPTPDSRRLVFALDSGGGAMKTMITSTSTRR